MMELKLQPSTKCLQVIVVANRNFFRRGGERFSKEPRTVVVDRTGKMARDPKAAAGDGVVSPEEAYAILNEPMLRAVELDHVPADFRREEPTLEQIAQENAMLKAQLAQIMERLGVMDLPAAPRAPEPEDEEGGDEDGDPAISDLSVDQLKELAQAHGVDITGLRKKADIIAAIEGGAAE